MVDGAGVHQGWCVALLLLLLLCLPGGGHPETLPTLTLQPYFTLSPPPLPSTRDTPSSPLPLAPKMPPIASSLPAGSEREREEEEVDTLVNGEEVQVEEGEEEEKEEVPQPHFSSRNGTVKVHLGSDATLDCMVLQPANQSVSWLRRVDDRLLLLTWDDQLYATDHRYSVAAATGSGWRRWRLVIGEAREEDEGQYRCQLATDPPKVLTLTLHVIVPVARVVDERGGRVREKHYNSGSRIELTCLIEQVPFPHGPVTWRRGPATLTYNTSRGGISVRGDPSAGFIRSRLYIADASPADSGPYTCCYHNITCGEVAVHVLAGENSAAMQHDGLPDSTSEGPGLSSSSSSTSSSSSPSLCAISLVHLSLLAVTSCIAVSSWTNDISTMCIFSSSVHRLSRSLKIHWFILSEVLLDAFIQLLFIPTTLLKDLPAREIVVRSPKFSGYCRIVTKSLTLEHFQRPSLSLNMLRYLYPHDEVNVHYEYNITR